MPKLGGARGVAVPGRADAPPGLGEREAEFERPLGSAGSSPGSQEAPVHSGCEMELWAQEMERLFQLYHDLMCSRLDERMTSLQEQVLRPGVPSSRPCAALGRRYQGVQQQQQQRRPSSSAFTASSALGPIRQEEQMLPLYLDPGPEPLPAADENPKCNEAAVAATPPASPTARAAQRGAAVVRRSLGSLRSSEGLSRGDETEMQGSWIRQLVSNPYFEGLFACAILSNAVFIGVQTDYAAIALTDEVPPVMNVVNACYTMLFTIELLLKLAHEKGKFFCGLPWAWNWLDLFIVVASLADLALDLWSQSIGEASSSTSSTSQFRILRILRITRLIRLVRVSRIVRFVRALRTMVHQIMSALKSLVWGLVLLLLMIYLFSIFFTQSVTQHLMDLGVGREDFPADAAILTNTGTLVRYWSTVPRSMFTLFKTISGGISWDECVHPLSDVGWSAVVLFVVFISFTELAVLNVLTGVFCQNAIDSAQHDQELVTQAILSDKEHFVKRVSRLFADMDGDRSGAVSVEELKEYLLDEKVQAYFDSMQIDTSDAWTLFKLMDADEGFQVDLDEFVTGCLRLRGPARSVDLAKLSYEQQWLAKKLSKFMASTEETLDLLVGHIVSIPDACSEEACIVRTSEATNASHYGTERATV